MLQIVTVVGSKGDSESVKAEQLLMRPTIRVLARELIRPLALRRGDSSALAQGLVEFALIIPLFVILIVGMTDFTLLVATQTSMATGTRNASRYGATTGRNADGVPHYDDCAGMREMVLSATLFARPSVEISYDPDGPGDLPQVEYCQGGIAADDIEIAMGGQVTVDSATTYSPVAQYFLQVIPDLPLKTESSHSLLMDIYIK
jgi:hypothetical protein